MNTGLRVLIVAVQRVAAALPATCKPEVVPPFSISPYGLA